MEIVWKDPGRGLTFRGLNAVFNSGLMQKTGVTGALWQFGNSWVLC